jgi:hypothetical protein
MLKKEASAIVGGLSTPGKMPCYSINLPATACKTGAKLARVPGTTCHGCYALKGRYRFKTTKHAMLRRLRALTHGSWTRAMTALITGHKYFRWHDSGDLQGAQHLKNIFEVCKQTPGTMHWLPTREHSLLKLMDPDVVPKNLIIRISATKVDGRAPSWWPWTSTVSTVSKTCPAPDQGGKCRDCRSCWSRDISNVTYAKH